MPAPAATPAPRLRVVGPGRAGASVAGALGAVGWQVLPPLGRADDLSGAAHDVDVLVLATPDLAVAATAAAVEPVAGTLVVHLAGSLTLDVLAPHSRRASLHPLVPLPDAAGGRRAPAAGGVVRRGRERACRARRGAAGGRRPRRAAP